MDLVFARRDRFHRSAVDLVFARRDRFHRSAVDLVFARRDRFHRSLLADGLTSPVPRANLASMENADFSLDFEVRDYECDLQGIVNNAHYQHYLEHARHQFLKARGLDFAEVTARGIFLIVVRIELDYKSPLKSGDRFRVSLRLERVSRIRFAFIQEIHRLDDGKLVLQARVITAAMNDKGRPMFPRELEGLLPQ